MNASGTRTLASGNIGAPHARRPRSLARKTREFATAGVLLVALPLAGCLSAAEAWEVEKEITAIEREIRDLEADDQDGTPLDPPTRAELTQLYQEREGLYAYRRAYSKDQGPSEAANWLVRIASGDVRAIGEAFGVLLTGEVGRRVYNRRKRNRAAAAPTPVPDTDTDTTAPDAPASTPSVGGSAANDSPLADQLRAMREERTAVPSPPPQS